MRDSKRPAFARIACLSAALAAWPSLGHAQARPRPVRHGHSVVIAGGYYQPFFDPYPWYLYPWYPFPFAGYPPYGPYPAAYDVSSSVRIEVTPREAEVYVDGYLAGTVDDFDGFFQRLHLPPGEHHIELHLDGYRSARQNLFLPPTGTYRLRYTMEALPAGEKSDPRPTPPPRQEQPFPARRAPEPESRAVEGGSPSDSRFGTLSLRVQPEGAEVLIDGERWEGPDAQQRLLVQVSSGTHRVEIRKEGYQPYSNDVRVDGGETETLNVSLPPLDRR